MRMKAVLKEYTSSNNVCMSRGTSDWLILAERIATKFWAQRNGLPLSFPGES